MPSAPMPTTMIIAASCARRIAAAAARRRTPAAVPTGSTRCRRPLASARAVAAATCSGVLDSGAGSIPCVIRPMTNPGRAISKLHPGAVQRVGQPAGEPVQPGLGRAVDVVGAAYPHPGHRGEHHQDPAAGRAHFGGQMGEQADLRDVVGVHDGHRVVGIGLGAGLVAEDPEGQHCGADGAVVGDDRGDQRAVRGQVVGVELPGVHRCRRRRL